METDSQAHCNDRSPTSMLKQGTATTAAVDDDTVTLVICNQTQYLDTTTIQSFRQDSN